MAEELLTVKKFAEQYRVDTETVRSWIKKGCIPYVLVGSRKMLRKAGVVVDIVPEPEDPIV